MSYRSFVKKNRPNFKEINYMDGKEDQIILNKE